ncbi:unnamed protein product [Gadus morhua 'NCC']
MVNQERLNINTATEEELMTLPGLQGGGGPSADPKHMSSCSGMNINTATPPQLMSIRGITEKIALNIVAYRTQHGPFKSIEDLVRVDHTNCSLLDKIRFQVFVECSRTPSTNTNGGLTYMGRSHPSPTSFSLRSDDLDLPPGGPTQMVCTALACDQSQDPMMVVLREGDVLHGHAHSSAGCRRKPRSVLAV